MDQEVRDWAQDSFGEAELGDPRRVRRLVAMAEQAARTPAGKVTEVFQTSAEREGAFRLLENLEVSSDRVTEAICIATARRSGGQAVIYVPIDKTTLTLTDRSGRRELGRVGTRWPTRGLHVMTALGVDAEGTVVGVLDQRWWAQRALKRNKKQRTKCFGAKYLERETRFWLESLEAVSHRLKQTRQSVSPWFQLDRGADCWPVLMAAAERNLLVTVRASHDRRLVDRRSRRQYLRRTLKTEPILGHYEIQLPERPNRAARTARIALRATQVTLWARVASKKRRAIVINAVCAEEVGYRGADRLCWFLLTTAPVVTFDQARAVVHGYVLRWRIEEFHRAWKNGLCRVEESQLKSRAALIKWASILAAVAARALRIAQLLRTAPDAPASNEFSDYEIAAAFALAKRKLDRRRRYTLKEVVDLVADVGGFANKYSGGYPGPTVLGRGLQRVRTIAIALKNIDEMR